MQRAETPLGKITAVSASYVSAISDWVRQESPSRYAAGVNAMMDRVLADTRGQPIAAERIPGRDGLGDIVVLRAGPRNGLAPLLLLSHLDTVHPVGTIAQDLPLRVEGDRLYGPGVYDMKGGAWLALQAFCKVVCAGTARRPLIFAFTPDEEIGSPTSRSVITSLARGARAALITEPARMGGRVVTSRKGTGRFEVRLTGRAAHSGNNHADGRSAILEAARQILAVEALTDYARGITVNVGLVKGGTSGNVVPRHAQFNIDCRVSNRADGQWLRNRILNLSPVDPEVVIDIVGDLSRQPYKKTPAVDVLLDLARKTAIDIGFDLLDCPMVGGGSDGNLTAAAGVPTLDGLGIDGDGAHTVQEYGLISSIAPRMALMQGMLEKI